MASITVDIDLPPGVRLGEYHRLPGGHGFEVAWPAIPSAARNTCCVCSLAAMKKKWAGARVLLYRLRLRFQRIFDTAQERGEAERRLHRLFAEMVGSFSELDRFVCTFENWWEPILNYFAARQSSGPVEGINNKARMIVKRCYGLKSADSLWTRLILDLNRAKDLVLYTIGQLKGLVTGFRPFFLSLCT